MTTQTTANGAAQDTTGRGFPGLRCLLCGQEGSISLNLDDVRTFNCPECGESFDVDVVAEQLERWGRVLAWCRQAPAAE